MSKVITRNESAPNPLGKISKLQGKISSILAPQGLKLHKVAGNGSCLFLAYLHQYTGRAAKPRQVVALRHTVVKHLNENPDDFPGFDEVAKLALCMQGYADERTIAALQRIHQVVIEVHKLEDDGSVTIKPYPYNPETIPKGRVIRISHVSYAVDGDPERLSSGHFDGVVPVKAKLTALGPDKADEDRRNAAPDEQYQIPVEKILGRKLVEEEFLASGTIERYTLFLVKFSGYRYPEWVLDTDTRCGLTIAQYTRTRNEHFGLRLFKGEIDLSRDSASGTSAPPIAAGASAVESSAQVPVVCSKGASENATTVTDETQETLDTAAEDALANALPGEKTDSLDTTRTDVSNGNETQMLCDDGVERETGTVDVKRTTDSTNQSADPVESTAADSNADEVAADADMSLIDPTVENAQSAALELFRRAAHLKAEKDIILAENRNASNDVQLGCYAAVYLADRALEEAQNLLHRQHTHPPADRFQSATVLVRAGSNTLSLYSDSTPSTSSSGSKGSRSRKRIRNNHQHHNNQRKERKK